MIFSCSFTALQILYPFKNCNVPNGDDTDERIIRDYKIEDQAYRWTCEDELSMHDF